MTSLFTISDIQRQIKKQEQALERQENAVASTKAALAGWRELLRQAEPKK